MNLVSRKLQQGVGATVSVEAAQGTQTVSLVIVLLAAIGVALIIVAVWLVRRTRPDFDLLAPLEAMGERKWRDRDPVWQRRRLDELRPEGAEPLQRSAAPPDIDTTFDDGPQAPGFDDLNEDGPKPRSDVDDDDQDDADSEDHDAADDNAAMGGIATIDHGRIVDPTPPSGLVPVTKVVRSQNRSLAELASEDLDAVANAEVEVGTDAVVGDLDGEQDVIDDDDYGPGEDLEDEQLEDEQGFDDEFENATSVGQRQVEFTRQFPWSIRRLRQWIMRVYGDHR